MSQLSRQFKILGSVLIAGLLMLGIWTGWQPVYLAHAARSINAAALKARRNFIAKDRSTPNLSANVSQQGWNNAPTSLRSQIALASPSTGVNPTPALTLTGNATFATFGYAVAGAGDINGDGYADLVVGSYGADSQIGLAYIYSGTAQGLSASPLKILVGYSGGVNFGYSVAGAGDVNQDGHDDLLIGESGLPYSYLYLGKTSGITTTPALTLTGEVVASAGDVNGDGYADLLSGYFMYFTQQGQAYLYLGNASGVPTSVLTLTGEAANNRFGYSVTSAGDVNHDNYSDFVIGAPYYNSQQGRAYLYLGSSSALTSTPVLTLTGEASSDQFANSIASAGDVNGDGYADIVMGAPGYNSNRGRAYVYWGNSTSITATPALTLTGENAGDQFGYSVASAGDVNQDGYADLLIGAPGNSGAAYLYLGSASGISATPALTLTGDAYSAFGASVANAGDVNGDGATDLAVGEYQYNSNQGRAFLYLGLPCTVVQNTNDNGSGSLRAAIACAQSGNTITFDSSLAGQTIVLTTTEIGITQTNLTIDGSNAPGIMIDGNNATRVFSVTAPLSIDSLIIQNGVTFDPDGGGGLYTTSALTLSNVSFLTNTSEYAAGGLVADSTAVLSNVLFADNSTPSGSSGGAWILGAATVNGGVFKNNSALDPLLFSSAAGSGGGLFVGGILNLTGTQFLANMAGGSGGGLRADGASTTLNNATFIGNASFNEQGGGALLDGAATVNGGLFEHNTAIDTIMGYGGGLMAAGGLTMTGTQFLTNTAGLQGGGLVAANATFTNVTFMDNQANNQYGGGASISTASVNGGLFERNTALDGGGGLYANSLNVVDTQFLSNTTQSDGGGLYASGGVTLTNVLLIANSASNGGGAYWAASSANQVVNTLFARNVAATHGDALYIATAAPLNLIDTTIASPTLVADTAIYIAAGQVNITNTIIASHTIGIQPAGGSANEWNTLYDGVATPSIGLSTSSGSITGSAAFVDPASDNYHLSANSQAINAGTIPNPNVTIDFDGDPRPQAGSYDIGFDETPYITYRLYLPLVLK